MVKKFLNKKADVTITILKVTPFGNGKIPYELEQRILKKHKAFQYKGPKVLKGGNTELFTKDVLGKDKS